MDEDIEQPTPRREVKEPITPNDYRVIMQKITQRPMKLICIFTARWPLDWYHQLFSELRYERDRSKHAMICNYWMKATKPKA